MLGQEVLGLLVYVLRLEYFPGCNNFTCGLIGTAGREIQNGSTHEGPGLEHFACLMITEVFNLDHVLSGRRAQKGSYCVEQS